MRNIMFPLSIIILAVGGLVQFILFMVFGPMFLYTWAMILSLVCLRHAAHRHVLLWGIVYTLPGLVGGLAREYGAAFLCCLAPWLLAVLCAAFSAPVIKKKPAPAAVLWFVSALPFLLLYGLWWFR